ncbi:hypothetical protein VPH35_135055 [Triticum aestivum]
MDASGAGPSSNPTPTRPRLTVDVEGRPSPTPPPALHAGDAIVVAPMRGPRTVEEIYEDFSARRSALVRALTTDRSDARLSPLLVAVRADQEELYGLLCEPGKKALCLYGHADGSWELRRPDELAPPHMPEPTLGVNFRPDYISPFAWLEFIAQRADSWLIGVAFFFAACLNANHRMRLFDMMNNLPTVYRTLYHFHKIVWLPTPPSPVLMQNVYNPKEYSGAPAQDSVPQSPDLMENVSNPNINSITPVEENMPLLSQDSWQNVSDPNKNSRTLAEEDEQAILLRRVWCSVPCQWVLDLLCVKITASESAHIKDYKCPDCTLEDTRE